MNRRRLLLVAFLLWEGYWASVFFRAPVPDYRMDSVFALLMGVFLPLAIVVPLGLILLVRNGRRRR